MNFGRIIEDARKAKDLRQEDVAEKLGVTQQAVQRWEANPVPPRSRYLESLCSLLGIEVPEMGMGQRAAIGAKAPRVDYAIEARNVREILDRETAPAPRAVPTPILIQTLQRILPPELAGYVAAATAFEGQRIRYTYFSPKVAVRVISAIPGKANSLARLAAWSLAVLRMSERGYSSLAPRHYALVTIPPEVVRDVAPLDVRTRIEIKTMEISLFEDKSIEELAKIIQDLEEKPTEMDEFLADMPDFSDMLEEDFDL